MATFRKFLFIAATLFSVIALNISPSLAAQSSRKFRFARFLDEEFPIIIQINSGASSRLARSDICKLPRRVGVCRSLFTSRALIPAYWFNYSKRRCELFFYGGCGGNANRFETRGECMQACGHLTRSRIF